MTAQQRAFVADYHQQLLDAFDIDYRVVTARGLADINRVAVELFRELGATSRSRQGRALLLLIDATSDRVRLEVGYPLEGSFPDAFVDYLERRQMVPFFEADRVADGILATTELIVARINGADVDLGAGRQAWVADSGGAGAVVDARIGAGPPVVEQPTTDAAMSTAAHRTRPGATPGETLVAYLAAMAAHDADPELSIYTSETRVMLAGWVITPAQMDRVLRTCGRCPAGEERLGGAGDLAVIRYPAAERACAPFFLRRDDDHWLLDLATMQRAVRFDAANAWRLVPSEVNAYQFAFSDWRFDSRGYPLAEPW